MKRKRAHRETVPAEKRQRVGREETALHPTVPLLERYYNEVHSLRIYLATRLPKSSKKQRRRVLQYGRTTSAADHPTHDPAVAELLDTIIVGTTKTLPVAELKDIDNDISVFTQQVSETDITLSPVARQLKQSEVGQFQLSFVALLIALTCHPHMFAYYSPLADRGFCSMEHLPTSAILLEAISYVVPWLSALHSREQWSRGSSSPWPTRTLLHQQ